MSKVGQPCVIAFFHVPGTETGPPPEPTTVLGAAYNLLSLMIVTSGQGTSPATALCMPQGLQTGNPETQENKDIPSLAKTWIRQKPIFSEVGLNNNLQD